MSNSSKSLRPSRPHALLASVILIMVVTGAATLASGAVGLNTAAVGLPDKDRSAPSRSTPPSSLRCWQFGKLIFEETGVDTPAPSLDGAREWTRVATPGSSLYLFHAGDTTCLYNRRQVP